MKQTAIDKRKQELQLQIALLEEQKKANEVFHKAPQNIKRILIAQDIIDAIKLKKYKPTTGTFVEFTNKNNVAIDDEEYAGLSVQEALLDNSFGTCDVCMIGSCFLSATKMNSDFKVKNDKDGDPNLYIGNKAFAEQMLKYYTAEQIFLMELAFEKGKGVFGLSFPGTCGPYGEDLESNDGINRVISALEDNKKFELTAIFEFHKEFQKLDFSSDKLREQTIKALRFSEKYSSDEKRLIALQRNIIKNNGELIF